jgi:hypothetical protein
LRTAEKEKPVERLGRLGKGWENFLAKERAEEKQKVAVRALK